MGTRPTVVVAGMGDTGVLVASNLGKGFDVVGVATRPALVSGQELGNRLARPEFWRRNNLTTFDRFRKLDRVHVVHGAISERRPRRAPGAPSTCPAARRCSSATTCS